MNKVFIGPAVTDDPASRGAAFKDHFSVVAEAYAAADFRAQIDAHYAGYDWPFPALPTPRLWLEAEWSLSQFVRYLSSLSASTRCLAETGDDPVARHALALAAAWGEGGDVRTLQWPLFLHLRRKP